MANIALVVDEPYRKNRIFDMGDASRIKYVTLRDEFAKHGDHLNTLDAYDEEDVINKYIFLDIPTNINWADYCAKSCFALLIESPIIKPENYKVENLKIFKKIFTWNNHLVKHPELLGRVEKIRYPICSENSVLNVPFDHKKLCCIVAANKSSKLPSELYSFRRRAIEWFEKHQPEKFDLYGYGWNKVEFSIFEKRNGPSVSLEGMLLLKLLGLFHSSYKGVIREKHEVISKYKFYFAFENALSLSGYISEKIFDAFLSGAVPVYIGASDIGEEVPPDSFIDARNFSDFFELYENIIGINEAEYNKMLEAGRAVIKKSDSEKFSLRRFSETIVSGVFAA